MEALFSNSIKYILIMLPETLLVKHSVPGSAVILWLVRLWYSQKTNSWACNNYGGGICHLFSVSTAKQHTHHTTAAATRRLAVIRIMVSPDSRIRFQFTCEAGGFTETETGTGFGFDKWIKNALSSKKRSTNQRRSGSVRFRKLIWPQCYVTSCWLPVYEVNTKQQITE